MECSDDLQKQVAGYYEYMWIRREGSRLSHVYNLLPEVFQADVALATYESIFEKV